MYIAPHSPDALKSQLQTALASDQPQPQQSLLRGYKRRMRKAIDELRRFYYRRIHPILPTSRRRHDRELYELRAGYSMLQQRLSQLENQYQTFVARQTAAEQQVLDTKAG